MNADHNIYRRKKIFVLIGLAIFWFITSTINVLLQPSGLTGTIVFLASALCWGFGIFFWCWIDAKERGDGLSVSEKVAIVAFGLLAFIWYLFHTRGAKGGFKALGWALLYVICTYVVLVALLTLTILISTVFAERLAN